MESITRVNAQRAWNPYVRNCHKAVLASEHMVQSCLVEYIGPKQAYGIVIHQRRVKYNYTNMNIIHNTLIRCANVKSGRLTSNLGL